MANIPKDVIFIWPGNHADIPTGWERVTALDGKYPKGAADGVNPNVTGGSSTHQHTGTTHSHTDSHTHTITIDACSKVYGNVDTGGGSSYSQQYHTHSASCGAVSDGSLSSVSCTYASVSNDPPYYSVIFITPTSGVNSLPNEAIYLYEDTDSRTGHYVCDGNSISPILGTYSTGLKGYWKFESGATTTDSSGNNHHLVPATAASEFLNGKYGGALSFKPLPQYYTIANHDDFNPTTLSISFWINTISTTYNGMIFTKYGGNYKGWFVRVAPNGKVYFTIGNGGTTNKDTVSTKTVNDGRWHHVACVFNGTDLRIYIDGQLDCEPLASGALVSDTAINVHLGRASWYDDNYSQGIIDDLAFWSNRSLTANDIEEIYLDGLNAIPNLKSIYLKGAAANANAGGTGGSTTNVHTLTHTHTVASHGHVSTTSSTPSATGGGTGSDGQKCSSASHTHTINVNSATSSISSTAPSLTTTETVEPAYTKLLAVQNRTGHGDARVGMIGMWLGTLASIPSNYELTSTNMKGRHLKLTATASEIGNTGGSNTHTHASQSHTHTASETHTHTHPNLTHTTAGEDNSSKGFNPNKKDESHTVTVSSSTSVYSDAATSADEQSNEPEYRTVAFIKLKSLSGGGAFLLNMI